MYEQAITRFEEFLRARRLVKHGQIQLYGHWVHRFLCFAREGAGESGLRWVPAALLSAAPGPGGASGLASGAGS